MQIVAVKSNNWAWVIKRFLASLSSIGKNIIITVKRITKKQAVVKFFDKKIADIFLSNFFLTFSTSGSLMEWRLRLNWTRNIAMPISINTWPKPSLTMLKEKRMTEIILYLKFGLFEKHTLSGQKTQSGWVLLPVIFIPFGQQDENQLRFWRSWKSNTQENGQ